ncbi:hypothetical protein GcC1_216031, partial [Golovinomyces cichoracearum]
MHDAALPLKNRAIIPHPFLNTFSLRSSDNKGYMPISGSSSYCRQNQLFTFLWPREETEPQEKMGTKYLNRSTMISPN